MNKKVSKTVTFSKKLPQLVLSALLLISLSFGFSVMFGPMFGFITGSAGSIILCMVRPEDNDILREFFEKQAARLIAEGITAEDLARNYPNLFSFVYDNPLFRGSTEHAEVQSFLAQMDELVKDEDYQELVSEEPPNPFLPKELEVFGDAASLVMTTFGTASKEAVTAMFPNTVRTLEENLPLFCSMVCAITDDEAKQSAMDFLCTLTDITPPQVYEYYQYASLNTLDLSETMNTGPNPFEILDSTVESEYAKAISVQTGVKVTPSMLRTLADEAACGVEPSPSSLKEITDAEELMAIRAMEANDRARELISETTTSGSTDNNAQIPNSTTQGTAVDDLAEESTANPDDNNNNDGNKGKGLTFKKIAIYTLCFAAGGVAAYFLGSYFFSAAKKTTREIIEVFDE